MAVYITRSAAETEALGAALAPSLRPGDVVALYGGLGMGKTAFVRGIASVLAPQAEVSSPTFALVHEYGGHPPLVHFDMYRVESWDDLYSTGFFDYLDTGAYLAIEWSENVYGALPPDTLMVEISKTGEQDRTIEIYKKEEEKA